VSIRLASIGELDALARMNVELRADERIDNIMTDVEVKDRMRGFLLGKTYKVHVFEENGEILGYSVVDVTRSPAYMRQFFIVRGSRRAGYGSKFFQLLVDALGADAIDVEVLVWNEGALDFYKKIGFHPRYVGMRLRSHDD
jgi:ribosomal protein S18 acetylase RimI-like enzyme